jgi:outer membrane receptor protein involved in Fe transport
LRAGLKERDGLGSGAGVGAALDPYGLISSRRLHADLSWNDIVVGAGWRLGATLSGLHYQQTFPKPLQVFPPGAFGGAFPQGVFGAPYTWERQWRFSAVASYVGWDGHQLRIGAGYDDLDRYRTRELKNFSFITSGPLTGLPAPTPGGRIIEFPVDQSFLAPHARRVKYAYVQDEWSLARDWTLTAGVRRDLYSDFGGTTNPRAALVWDATLDLTAKLLYGRAFRPPAFTGLYSINNPVTQGRRALRPEPCARWRPPSPGRRARTCRSTSACTATACPASSALVGPAFDRRDHWQRRRLCAAPSPACPGRLADGQRLAGRRAGAARGRPQTRRG